MMVAAATVAHATLIYNDGDTENHQITTALPDQGQGSIPDIVVSNSTAVDWNTGASYAGTNINAGAFLRLYDDSAFNLNDGLIDVKTVVADKNLYGFEFQSGYSGTLNISGGTLNLSEPGNGNSQVRAFVQSGTPANYTVNVTGGNINLTEANSGYLFLIRVFTEGGSGTYNLLGGTCNLSETGGQLTLIQLQAGTPTVNLTGGNFNLSSTAAITLFTVAAGTLNISGGDFTANQNLIGSVSVTGSLFLDGSFTGLTNGVYTTANWVNGPVSGTLTNGSPFSMSSLTLAGAGTITIGGNGGPPPPPPPPPPPTRPDPYPGVPNIIYIMADDMGYSDIGCYGGEIETPNIDRLANEGLRFRQFYNNAKCETTRSALLSGRYHVYSGLQAQNGTTLGAVMQSGGYQTYGVGKWHIGSGDTSIPTARGFDNFYGFYGGGTSYFSPGPSSLNVDCQQPNNFVVAYSLTNYTLDSSTRGRHTTFVTNYYATDNLGDHAVASINDAVANHTNRPFFMYLCFNAPHAPAEAPQPLVDKYWNLYTNGWDVLRPQKWARQKAMGLVEPQWQLPNFPLDVPRWNDLSQAARDSEVLRRSQYGGQVDSMDQNIGKLLARLDELNATTHPGIVSNTIIMFCSDNGCAGHDASLDRNQGPGWATLSDTPFRYFKQNQQQGGICTPMIVRWPKVVKAGTMTDQPGHIVDIMATVNDVGHCDYNSQKTPGGSPVPPMSGASLLPILQGGTRPPPDFWGFELHQNEFAVIKGDWKLASFRSSPWRLYNLHDDRTETRNLRFDYPEKAAELAALYDQWAPDNIDWIHRDPIEMVVGHEPDFRYGNPVDGLYRNPSVGKTFTNIGTVASSDISDEAEYCLFHNASDGFGSGSDNFSYLCQRFFGYGEASAQLETMSSSIASSRSGVMVRESLTPGSPFVMTAITSDGTCLQLVRSATNGPVTTVASAPGAVQLPTFVRVKRQGDVFTSSYSTNEYYWVDFATVTNQMGADVFGGVAAASGSPGTSTYFQWREWENRDIAQYPMRARAVDGLPEVLGYALGADESTDARNRQPFIQMTNVSSSTFPELNYVRRKNTNGLAFGYLGGATPSSLVEDSANWVQTGAAPGPDADSERVSVRRLIDAQTATNGFFRLKVVAP